MFEFHESELSLVQNQLAEDGYSIGHNLRLADVWQVAAVMEPATWKFDTAPLTQAIWDAITDWPNAILRPCVEYQKKWGSPDGPYPESILISDPDADPKPTWADLVSAHRRSNIASTLLTSRIALQQENSIPAVRRRLTDKATITLDDGLSVHVGDGLDHMTGLLQMVEHANIAGEAIPYIVMRSADGARRHFYSQRKIRALLSKVAARENRVESAHNAFMELYRAQVDIAADETASLDDREAAAAKVSDYTENYEKHLKAQMDAYDPDALPDDDLDELKEALIERLEGVAMAHVDDTINARSQQGVDLGGSCRDQTTALQEVSRTKQQHQILIERADDADDAKAKFAAGVTAIQAIKAERTPRWYDDKGMLIVDDTFGIPAVSGFVQARSPMEGKVAGTAQVIGVDDATPPNPHATVQFLKSGDNASFLLGIVEGTAPARFRLRAMNICGPSYLEVTLTPPAS